MPNIPLAYVSDSSGRGFHGNFRSAAALSQSGKDGLAYGVNAVSNGIFAASGSRMFEPTHTTPWAFSVWWYPVNATDNLTLFDNSVGATSHNSGGIQIFAYIGSIYASFADTPSSWAGAQFASAPITATAWNHIMVVWSGSQATGSFTNFTIYVNGVSGTLTNWAVSPGISSDPGYQRVPFAATNATDGVGDTNFATSGNRLDMWAFWSGTVLSASNVASIFANPTASYVVSNFGTGSGLVVMYGLDETDKNFYTGFVDRTVGGLSATYKGQFLDEATGTLGQGAFYLGMQSNSQSLSTQKFDFVEMGATSSVGPGASVSRRDWKGFDSGIN